MSDPGCHGCSDRECCSDDAFNGDCNGYPNYKVNDEDFQNETKAV